IIFPPVVEQRSLAEQAGEALRSVSDIEPVPSTQISFVPSTDVFELRADEVIEQASLPDLPPVNSAERFVKIQDVPQASSGKIHPIGQLHESFIVATDNEGLLLVDQHVAHERILFDKFKTRGAEAAVESQNLLLPETIDLTPAQGEIFHLIENDL